MTGQLLTIQETAEMLRCSPRTVRRRIASGELPAFRDRALVRLRHDDVAGYIARRVPYAAVRVAQPARVPGPGRAVESGTLFDRGDPLP